LAEESSVRLGAARIAVQFFEPPAVHCARTIVMLHEGLGSIEMWKQFPARLACQTGARVLAYSRFGYGKSDALPAPYPALEMHEKEAIEVLPALLRALSIESPILFGHSDGASIALIHAGNAPCDVSGVIVLAPHVFVEEMCLASIERARRTFIETDLREKLAPYHDDPERAFWRWNNVWLDPAFRQWNIEHYLATIKCPVLAVQGHEDEYGTMAQLERIACAVPNAQLLKLQACRHSPHRDQAELVLNASRQFVSRL